LAFSVTAAIHDRSTTYSDIRPSQVSDCGTICRRFGERLLIFSAARPFELYPLPADIVALAPAYEGYLYFVLEDGTIVIVEPETLEVAYVLTA